MVTYEGSHGTTKKRATLITKGGFKLGGGRHGGGVYFWSKNPYYIDLAIGWHNHCCIEGYYSDEAKAECAVILVDLNATKDEVLDLNNALLKCRLAQLVRDKKINQNNRRQVASFFDEFIRNVEEEIGVAFRIVLTQTGPPPRCDYPIKILGPPECCIARDTKCIKIKKSIFPEETI